MKKNGYPNGEKNEIGSLYLILYTKSTARGLVGLQH